MKSYCKLWALMACIIMPVAIWAWIIGSSAKGWLTAVLICTILFSIYECRDVRYKLGPVMYDSERELYYIHVGIARSNNLLYTCYGKTYAEAQKAARKLISYLNSKL